jgi:RNA polymerase sigma factor (sigma-70 family)
MTLAEAIYAIAKVLKNIYREFTRIGGGKVPDDRTMGNLARRRDSRAVDGGLEGKDRDRLVRQAVLALPPKYREALVLFYFHDMDIPAAARSLGLPEGTVKARLFRGRDILRSKLTKTLRAPGLE